MFESVHKIEKYYLDGENLAKLEPEAKHTNQQNKIVDWMSDHKLISEVPDNTDRLFIEYGAGRAGLSSFVADRMSKQMKSKFIIVDRDTRR